MIKKLVLRTERGEGGTIRPFINDWNVWTLKKSEFTPAVQQAILNAYRLGNMHTIMAIHDAANRLGLPFQPKQDWKL